ELRERGAPVTYAKHRRWVRYEGPVWCVSTENGIILVRRNRKPVWCGNCYESYEPGLNPNVKKIRESAADYFGNVISRGDGSLLDGIATNLIWSANHRTLRWVIEMRTDPSAEVEIRMVFNQIAEICIRDYPYLYSDFVTTELPDGTKSYRPKLRSKV